MLSCYHAKSYPTPDGKATLKTIIDGNETNPNVAEWNSNNETVATVDNNGIVTTKAPGTATITVTAQDGGFTASWDITVKTPVISVTGITLNKNTLPLDEGQTETLIVTVMPENATDKTIIWTSSNDAVATVTNEGKVTAKAAGTATISATTQDGGKQAVCSVNVTARIVPVTGVTLFRPSSMITATITLKMRTLIATVSPENATNKNVTWASSNTNVVTVDKDGILTAISLGTATITVTTQDGNKTATCDITVVPCGCD
jgi:uncharacterized protein YjdB